MKKLLLISLLLGASLLNISAQDDMYFTPKKKGEVKQVEAQKTKVAETYYSGSDRDVDEYNRRNLHSSYEMLGTDSLGTDIIDFTAGNGEYSDSTIFADNYDSYYADDFDDSDFQYSRRMGRFYDFYGWYDPVFFSYYHYPYWRHGYYGWYDPWYSRWYDPWYNTYYGWGYYGWGWPYYRDWYGWYRPYYPGYYGSGWVTYAGHTGTANHDGVGRSFGGTRGNSTLANSRGNFSGRRGSTVGNHSGAARRGSTNGVRQSTRSNNGNFSGSRSNRDFDAINGGPRNMGSYNSYPSGSGSSRSGGGFTGGHSGGSRGGGGGHFTGRR